MLNTSATIGHVMNPKLRRMVGSEIFEQLQRVNIVADTDRGEFVVTDGEPRLYRVGWKKAVVGFADEPWDGFSGRIRANDILDIEKLDDLWPPPGTPPRLPRWWYVSISLHGWFGQRAYIDGKQILSKDPTNPWSNVGVPQAAFVWCKLGEHEGAKIPAGWLDKKLTLDLRIRNLMGRLHLLR